MASYRAQFKGLAEGEYDTHIQKQNSLLLPAVLEAVQGNAVTAGT